MKFRNKSTPRYTVARDGDEYHILHGDKPVATPMGNPLRTIFKDLAEEMTEDLERQGPDPTAGVSMYNCQCSCLDFAGIESKAMNAAISLREDPVLHMSADPEIMFTQMAAYTQPYFDENKLREKNSKDLEYWVVEAMLSWSMHEVMVVELARVHIRSPLIGMALAQNKANLEAAAFGFCGKFWKHKMNNQGGICIGSIPEFYPNRPNKEFCDTVCLSERNEAMPPTKAYLDRFRRKCGAVIAFDVWRRFAAYGRNQRPTETVRL